MLVREEAVNGSRRNGSEKRRSNGALEAEILAALHAETRSLTPSEIADRLVAPPAHTTVATTVARLHDRGVLERTRQGRSYTYAPVADEAGMTAIEMHRLMERRGDPASVLARFVDELSDEDEDILRRLLNGPL